MRNNVFTRTSHTPVKCRSVCAENAVIVRGTIMEPRFFFDVLLVMIVMIFRVHFS